MVVYTAGLRALLLLAWRCSSMYVHIHYRLSSDYRRAHVFFFQGVFSGNPNNKFQVDKIGLAQLTPEKVAQGLQSRPGNLMAGVPGRADLLVRLSKALDEKKEYFGEDGRPGNMIGKTFSCRLFVCARWALLTVWLQNTCSRTLQHRPLLCLSCRSPFYGMF